RGVVAQFAYGCCEVLPLALSGLHLGISEEVHRDGYFDGLGRVKVVGSRVPGWIVRRILHVAEVGMKLEAGFARWRLRAFGDKNRCGFGGERGYVKRAVGRNKSAVE